MEYWFYHLEHSTLESTLPSLLEKSRQRGWNARLQFTSAQRLAEIDDYLWSYKADSFLPHGRDDAPMADKQPILLTLSPVLDPDAATPDIVFLIDGAQPDDLTGVTRCITMVDSQDENGRSVARARWSAAKEQGAQVSYWRQDDTGRWAKQ